MAYMLEAISYVAVSANTTERAFDLLQNVHFDAMLISLTLGDPSGEEFAAKAKRLQHGLKVIVVSGYPPPSALPESIDGYVQKPFTMPAINAELVKVIATPSARKFQ